MRTKVCRKCGSSERYPPASGRSLGNCAPCAKKREADRWAKDVVGSRAIAREKRKRWREANPELLTQWARANPEKDRATTRARNLRKMYNLTVEDYERMLENQGGRCAGCLRDKGIGPGGVFHVDHCHLTGNVRGLLCSRCNTGLGLLGDNSETLRRLIDYVEGSVYKKVG